MVGIVEEASPQLSRRCEALRYPIIIRYSNTAQRTRSNIPVEVRCPHLGKLAGPERNREFKDEADIYPVSGKNYSSSGIELLADLARPVPSRSIIYTVAKIAWFPVPQTTDQQRPIHSYVRSLVPMSILPSLNKLVQISISAVVDC